MTRDEYGSILISKGFKFEKTTLSYPSWRGDEDIYSHKPEYKFTFRVFRTSKNKPDYGLYVGIGSQFKSLDAIVKHNEDSLTGVKSLPIWTDDAFIKLVNQISSGINRNRKWSNEDADELVTVILPIINDN